MKARIIRDTKEMDFPFLEIAKGSIVEVVGSQLENGTIPVRVLLNTEYEKTTLVKVKDLEGIENE